MPLLDLDVSTVRPTTSPHETAAIEAGVAAAVTSRLAQSGGVADPHVDPITRDHATSADCPVAVIAFETSIRLAPGSPAGRGNVRWSIRECQGGNAGVSASGIEGSRLI